MAFIDEILSGDATLSDTEEYMRDLESDIKIGMVHLAISLGAIKKYQKYLDVAASFQAYIEQERTHLGRSQAERLAKIGDNYLRYRKQIADNGIMLHGNMDKVRIIDPVLEERDPMFWPRLKKLSFRKFRDYQEEKKHVYLDVYHSSNGEPDVSVKGAGLYVGDQKVKGLNMNDVRQKAAEGKRALVLWIDDTEAAYKRAKRAIEKTGVEEE